MYLGTIAGPLYISGQYIILNMKFLIIIIVPVVEFQLIITSDNEDPFPEALVVLWRNQGHNYDHVTGNKLSSNLYLNSVFSLHVKQSTGFGDYMLFAKSICIAASLRARKIFDEECQ